MPPRTLKLASLGAFLLIVGGCAPTDTPTSTNTRIASVQGQHGNLAFVAGELGTTHASVAERFEMSASTLKLVGEAQDDLGFVHRRYAQRRNGIRVVAGDLRTTENSSGEIVAASAPDWAGPSQDPSAPALDVAGAAQIAAASTIGATAAGESELVYVATAQHGVVLGWQVEITGRQPDGLPIRDLVFVDAANGEVVARHPQIYTGRNRETFDAGGSFFNKTLARSEGEGPTGDTDVDLAHDAAGITYDCLNNLFDRDSYDGAGSTLESVANFGSSFQNAFWNGGTMTYGGGFAEIDVGTHEMGHGVTEATAALIYQNESGALNEAQSDILQAVCNAFSEGQVTQATWDVGEALSIGAIRFMDDPVSDGNSTDHYSTRYMGTEDNGGVHLNSGIANLQFYLLSEGGVHPRRPGEREVVGIGIEKAGQVFYRSLANYMNENTDFAMARVVSEQAAADLYGLESSEYLSVSEAWFAVGVGEEPPEHVRRD